MKRLTKRNEKGIANFCGEYGNPPYPVVTQEILDKIADYEDTGFTPEEIDCIAKFFKEQTSEEVIADNMKTVAKLLEWSKWKDAEEEGRLVVLPVKVGDTVFAWNDCDGGCSEIDTGKVFAIGIDERGTMWLSVRFESGLKFYYPSSNIGKDVFLTKEEAEAALEKMKGETNDQCWR